jgi:hypothetical protein
MFIFDTSKSNRIANETNHLTSHYQRLLSHVYHGTTFHCSVLVSHIVPINAEYVEIVRSCYQQLWIIFKKC